MDVIGGGPVIMIHVFGKTLPMSLWMVVVPFLVFNTGEVWAQSKQPTTVQSAKAGIHTSCQEKDYAQYRGYIWRLDSSNRAKLPRNFRMASGEFKKDIPVDKAGRGFRMNPSRKGLSGLHMSGSAEFSEGELDAMIPVVRQAAKGPIYVVDLRQESHGLFNGDAVSWYGKHDWGNIGRDTPDVLREESRRLKAAKGKNVVVVKLDKDKCPANPKEEKVFRVMREQQLVERKGLHYIRIAATDHVWPSAQNIDAFLLFLRTLPADAWLHFHCQAGKGRTTTYMALYDMIKNPDVSLDDILSRQYLLGGAYLAYESPALDKKSWKAACYHQKNVMIKKLYQYVQENRKNNFAQSWSAWLACQNNSALL